MAYFENPMFDDTFDPYARDAAGDGVDDDVLAYNLPDAVIDPPLDVQQELNAGGDNIQNLRGELRQTALDDQKRRLVNIFYDEVERAYRLRESSIDYDQFSIDDDDKTLYWIPGVKKIPISTTMGGFRFVKLSTLARKYGSGGTVAIWSSLGLTGYKSGPPRLNKEAAETLQKTEETIPKNTESVEMRELPGVANGVIQASIDVETALKTIDDRPIDTAWVPQFTRELAGLEKATTRTRDELVFNLAKLSDVESRKSQVEKHSARERQKLAETNDPEMQQKKKNESESLRAISLTSSLKNRQGSKPPQRMQKISGHSGPESKR